MSEMTFVTTRAHYPNLQPAYLVGQAQDAKGEKHSFSDLIDKKDMSSLDRLGMTPTLCLGL